MATLAEIYNWFMTGKKPTQPQFWASWGSFWHKLEKIPINVIDGLTGVLNNKTENSQFDAHKVAADAHQALFDLKADKTDLEFSQIKKMVTLYSGGAQEFTLPTFAQIIEVSVNGKSTENYTEVSDTVVSIQDTITSGQQVVIQYLVDINTNTVPYYTQAQVDAMFVNDGGASGEYAPTISNISGVVTSVFKYAYWRKIGSLTTVNIRLLLDTYDEEIILHITTPTAINSTTTGIVGKGIFYNSTEASPVFTAIEKLDSDTVLLSFFALDGASRTLDIELTYKH